ncbi:MAG: aminotransferase class V-fold PLP-dependent enzyme, partial [Acidimicrobiia bacterium]|nr:aminotransferase class V-fold PLP-dependent enzyme [Acidimicrobiia bacterium]
MRSPTTHGLDYKDAVFISPHKFIGGPGTPGILVVRRELLTNRVPSVPGGGTVSYVNPDHHSYVSDPEHREEGGTPAILESIRAGLVFKLKESVGIDEIRRREEAFIRRAIDTWSKNSNIDILGNPEADRLSIVSFVVRAPEHLGAARHLHHNFVVAVLNDVFGIQARGGCSCAGPYGHRLLGIGLDLSQRFEHEIAAGCEVIKPGWVRVNFNYFISEEEFDFIIEAVDAMAAVGWRLLPDYDFEPATALWRHRAGTPDPPMSLHDVDFGMSGATIGGRHARTGAPAFSECLSMASELMNAPRPMRDRGPDLPSGAEALRWFPLPAEV